MKALYPLAVYTADHGLEWSYPKGEIAYGELDQCRKAFGRLPDFDAGDPGFEGVLITPKHVFAVHCQNVAHRDFRNRNATYISVSWVPRADAASVDFEALLASPSIREPLQNFPNFFEADATAGGATAIHDCPRQLPDFRQAGVLAAQLPEGATAVLKRRDGESAVACRYAFPSEPLKAEEKLSDLPSERIVAASPMQVPEAVSEKRWMPVVLVISLCLNVLLLIYVVWLRMVPFNGEVDPFVPLISVETFGNETQNSHDLQGTTNLTSTSVSRPSQSSNTNELKTIEIPRRGK